VKEEIVKNNAFEPMSCREVGTFLPLFVLGGQGMTSDEYKAIKYHLQTCSRCARAYKETGFVTKLIQSQKDALIGKDLVSRPDKLEIKREPTIKESYEEFQDKCRRGKAKTRRNIEIRRLKVSLKISVSVAACFIIGVFTYLAFLAYSTSKTIIEPVANTVSAEIPKVELLSNNTKVLISPGRLITSGSELKTLLINGKHKMVMNIGTSLSIEPKIINSNLGCLVKLNSGEIYTHVEHDGNPFIVQTANGKATITGTTFNIKATSNNMILVVTEGTVQLQSEKGKVSVGAGQLSEIVDSSAPTKPATCGVEKLTAWATGHKTEPTLAQTKSNNNDNSWQPPLSSLRPEPIELSKTDYKSWVEEKREWFSRNFPWIFELKDALAREEIEVDYPELLIQTGDVWQFKCLNDSQIPARFSMADFDSLLKVAVTYGFDEKWLLENVLSAKIALGQKSLLQNTLTGLKAFEQLLKYTEGKEEPPYGFYITDACKYIAETRSLIWFAVRDGKSSLTETQRTEVLNLLQQEVIAACNCQYKILYFEDEQKVFCDKAQSTEEITEYIRTMKIIKEKFSCYDIIH